KIERRKELGLPVEDDVAVHLVGPVPAEPRPTKWEVRKNVREREAAKQTTPATQAELGRLKQQVTKLQAALHAVKTGGGARRSESASVQPDDGLRYRSGGFVVGGPF